MIIAGCPVAKRPFGKSTDFQPVGFYYADFAPTTDDEIGELLRKAGSPVSGAVPGRAMRRGV